MNTSGSSIVMSYRISLPTRVSFSMICMLPEWKRPPRPNHVESSKLMESMTSVSPCQVPDAVAIERGQVLRLRGSAGDHPWGWRGIPWFPPP